MSRRKSQDWLNDLLAKMETRRLSKLTSREVSLDERAMWLRLQTERHLKRVKTSAKRARGIERSYKMIRGEYEELQRRQSRCCLTCNAI